jgi:GH25 family lysozyme M1 (1,4-beta-N-acetylmuramidase)
MPIAAKPVVTIFGWDASHYDGVLTRTILDRAKAEGVAFFTHKIGQGLSNVDDTQATALAAARDAGIEVIGGYYYLDDADMVAQARRCVALADLHEPWWRDFGGWFFQTDAERTSSGRLPSPAEIQAFSDMLADLTGRTVIVYASRGMYGDRLAGLGHPLWNADYGSNPHTGFKVAYPGNSGRGWTAYSGQTPLLWQYGSNTTIAGLSTCDANAYRGTIAQLLAAIGAHPDPAPDGGAMPITTDDNHTIWHGAQLPAAVKGAPDVSGGQALIDARAAALAAAAGVAGLGVKVDALTAAVAALAQHGGSIDTAAVIAAVNAVGDRETAAVAALKSALAASEQAAAAALAKL